MSIINTNLLSLRAQTNIGRAQNQLSSAMERLSSGLRVNSSKDDAAGQAIGNRFLAQTTGLNQAARNANDGISLAQTAQGVLDSINNKLQRIRELTVQGLNGTLSLRDSDAIQAEINQNLQEIDRLVATSKYNGVPLLSGKAGSLELQVGAKRKRGQVYFIMFNASAITSSCSVKRPLSNCALTAATAGETLPECDKLKIAAISFKVIPAKRWQQ